MSVKTWLNEFYPIPADAPMTNLEAVQHSLKKWRGLTDSNLKRHCVNTKNPANSWLHWRSVNGRSQGNLIINADSCALCQKHDVGDGCRTCPIVRTTGRRCDERKYGKAIDGMTSPWHEFDEDMNPMPMIAMLEKTERALIREQMNYKKRKLAC